MPDEIADIAFQNKAVVYDILFRAASETLRTIAADPQHLGAEIGFLGRAAHLGISTCCTTRIFIVSFPAAASRPMASSWIALPAGVLPAGQRVLSRMFRGLFLHYLTRAFAAGTLNFFSAHRHLHEPAAFRRYLAPVRDTDCRVGGDVIAPTPHRPGRADFPHPVPHERDSLAAA